MDPNTPRSPKRASEGPYRLRKRIKAVQYADNPARKESNKKRVPGLLAHFQWSFNNGVDFWTPAFPKFQDTVQQAFTNDQAKKQLQHISSQHGQMEGDDDYPNLLESGLDSLNLPEDISRNVDQFLNRIPDSRYELEENLKNVHMSVRQMRDTCAQVCRHNSEAPDEQASRSDLVESWALNIFKRNLKDCISQVRESKISKDNLLLGLVGSAVIEMIFEPAFPAFIQAPKPVAEAYRELILDIYGENGNKEEAPRQNDVFSLFLIWALQFKIDLISTTTRLKFFYYETDEVFDDTRMERCMFSDRENNTIKACLFPLLLYAPAGEESQTSKDYVLEHNTNYSI
ncbi:uncharacterized protein FFMR_12948 [Fusarium fujikuroi]|nr:uncharacterized protein FFMR_12948 [Fusarium fujikuroi]